MKAFVISIAFFLLLATPNESNAQAVDMLCGADDAVTTTPLKFGGYFVCGVGQAAYTTHALAEEAARTAVKAEAERLCPQGFTELFDEHVAQHPFSVTVIASIRCKTSVR